MNTRRMLRLTTSMAGALGVLLLPTNHNAQPLDPLQMPEAGQDPGGR